MDIRHALSMTLRTGVAEDGLATYAPIPAELSWSSEDPLAVALTMTDDAGPVSWTFARSLLAGGIRKGAGDGDIHISPCMFLGDEAVRVDLRGGPREGSPATAAMWASRYAVAEFLDATYRVIRLGFEDVDIAPFLASWLKESA